MTKCLKPCHRYVYDIAERAADMDEVSDGKFLLTVIYNLSASFGFFIILWQVGKTPKNHNIFVMDGTMWIDQLTQDWKVSSLIPTN